MSAGTGVYRSATMNEPPVTTLWVLVIAGPHEGTRGTVDHTYIVPAGPLAGERVVVNVGGDVRNQIRVPRDLVQVEGLPPKKTP